MYRKRLTNTLSDRFNPVLISGPLLPSRMDSAIPEKHHHANLREFTSAYISQDGFRKELLGKGTILILSGGVELPAYSRIDDNGAYVETDMATFSMLPEWKRALCYGKGRILAVSIQTGECGRYLAIATHALRYVPAHVAYVLDTGNKAPQHNTGHMKTLFRK